MPMPRRYHNHAQRQAAYRERQTKARKEELTRRGIPPLPAIPTLPGWHRWNAMAEQSLWLLNTMQQEMQDYFDQRSEAWQESERAETLSEHLQAVEEAIAAVEALGP